MANGKEYDVMGYWDCPVCQTKKIKGTVRDCPNCGAPRGKDVRFYMDGEDVRLTEEEEKKKEAKEEVKVEETRRILSDACCCSVFTPFINKEERDLNEEKKSV